MIDAHHWAPLVQRQIEHATAQGFDPFTATLEEAQAQPDANENEFDGFGGRAPGAVRRWENAQDINSARAYLEAHPIDGVAHCLSEGLIVPTWLAICFLEGHQKVANGEVGTWDKAFGPAKPKGVHLSTVAQRAKYGYHLRCWFRSGSGSRSDERVEQVAEDLAISEKVVRKLMRTELPRKNVRGRKP